MAQTASVTGQRLTSDGKTFTIADSANAKASGDYRNYLTSWMAFTFAQSETRRLTRSRERGRVAAHRSHRGTILLRIRMESRPHISKPNKSHTSSSNVRAVIGTATLPARTVVTCQESHRQLLLMN